MSQIDRAPNIYPDHYTAADIIADVICTDEGTLRGTVKEAAQALKDSGRLMPELPEPVWRPHAEHEFRYLAWPVPVVGQVERSPRPGALIAITDGDEDIITFTEQQAREVAAALLSAAAWAEKQ